MHWLFCFYIGLWKTTSEIVFFVSFYGNNWRHTHFEYSRLMWNDCLNRRTGHMSRNEQPRRYNDVWEWCMCTSWQIIYIEEHNLCKSYRCIRGCLFCALGNMVKADFWLTTQWHHVHLVWFYPLQLSLILKFYTDLFICSDFLRKIVFVFYLYILIPCVSVYYNHIFIFVCLHTCLAT